MDNIYYKVKVARNDVVPSLLCLLWVVQVQETINLTTQIWQPQVYKNNIGLSINNLQGKQNLFSFTNREIPRVFGDRDGNICVCGNIVGKYEYAPTKFVPQMIFNVYKYSYLFTEVSTPVLVLKKKTESIQVIDPCEQYLLEMDSSPTETRKKCNVPDPLTKASAYQSSEWYLCQPIFSR